MTGLLLGTTFGAVAGCASGIASYRGILQNRQILIPRNEAVALTRPNGVMLVSAPNLNDSIIVRNVPEHGLVALSALCTHRGCEVRAMPGSLQCPCHGSEYDSYGEVIEGPAQNSLRRYTISENAESYVLKL